MPTLLEAAQTNDNFNILVAAIGFVDGELDAGLATALGATDADLTVFAPTDTAFSQLAVDLGFTGDTADEAAITNFIVDTLPAELIRDVILYHVSPGTQLLASFSDGIPVTTLLTDATFSPDGPTLVDNEPDLIDPTLVDTDLVVDNGVIHVIDRVLIPADLDAFISTDITSIVAASGGTFDSDPGDFDILFNAVVTAGLGEALADPNADLTVFAPTDAAFVATAQALGFDGTDEGAAFEFIVEALTLLGGGDPIPLLQTVLGYHVAPESLQSAQVLGTDSITTLIGAELGVDGAELVDLDPDLPNAGFKALDIQASNGVVHVIDGVLISADLLASDGSGDVDFIIGDDTEDVFLTQKDADFVDGNGGADLIFSGAGDDTVLGGFGSDTIFGGTGEDMLLGGRGHDSIFGGAGNDVIKGEWGRDNIFGGAGNDMIEGGKALDTLVGGAGDDLFIYSTGDRKDTILDFDGEHDMIDLSGLGITGFDDVEAAAKDRPFGTTLKFGKGDKLVLLGVDVEDLDADDFIFAAPVAEDMIA